MKKVVIEIKKTCNLSDDCILIINDLKNQHWKYTQEEHMKWFKENIEPDDEHLLIWEERNLLAYLNLVYVDVEIDKQYYKMIGVGNVCVSRDKEHAGIGSILMAAANAFLKEINLCGLVLCHENTLGFYEYCEWTKLDARQILVKGNSYESYVMFYDPGHNLLSKVDYFKVDRSF